MLHELQKLLIKVGPTEPEVRELGPLDHDTMDSAELGRIQRQLENISRGCPAVLRDPIRTVAAAIARFRSVSILSDDEVVRLYIEALSHTPPRQLAPEIMPRALGAKAIEQYLAAAALDQAVGAVWDAFHPDDAEPLDQ